MITKVKSNHVDFNKKICLTLIIIMVMSLLPFATDQVYAETTDPVEEPTQYTVTLNGMGVSILPPTIKVTSGGIYGTLPQPKKTHYQFKGWFTDRYDGDEITSGAIATEDVKTLYARWEGNEYKITLDPNRAVLGKTVYTVNYGDGYSFLPKPSRTGLIFNGWYTKKVGGTKISPYNQTTITANTTLYAKWSPIWYLQTDRKWKRMWYRVRRESSTIGSAGCGPTAMSMAVASLKNTRITPVQACKWSKSKGYKAYLSGTKDGFFKAYGKKNGIKVKQTYYGDLRYTRKSKAKKYHNQAKEAVKKGNWVIVLAGKGKWTRGSGHFILWYKTEGDYALIRDSNSTSTARAKAKVSTLQKQAKRYWIISVPTSKRVN